MDDQSESGDGDENDSNAINDDNDSKDTRDGSSEDSDAEDDEQPHTGAEDDHNGDDENTDGEDAEDDNDGDDEKTDGEDGDAEDDQDSDYPPMTPPNQHPRPPANWRGDSPRPGPAAELLSKKLSIQRQQVIDRRKSRGSSTWDHSVDVGTPLKPDIDDHDEIRPVMLADPSLHERDNGSSTENDNVFKEARREVVPKRQRFFPPNFPRSRLPARTLPGRTIEQRGQALQTKRNLRRLPRVCYKSLHSTGVRVVKQSPDLEDDDHDEMSSTSSNDDDAN